MNEARRVRWEERIAAWIRIRKRLFAKVEVSERSASLMTIKDKRRSMIGAISMVNGNTRVLDVPDLKKLQWLEEAYNEARYSPDPSTQNGAILVSNVSDGSWWHIGFGRNEFPEGVESTPERLERPLKYSVVEHAERSAIYWAAKDGQSTSGAVMIAPWFACADCARAIIRAGITHVIGHKQVMDKTSSHPSWVESITLAFKMLDEAGVTYEFYDGEIGAKPVRFNGEYWTP